MKKIKDIAGVLLVTMGYLLVTAVFLFVGSGMLECCVMKLLEALGL